MRRLVVKTVGKDPLSKVSALCGFLLPGSCFKAKSAKMKETDISKIAG